ncbi:GNAT family N-acetyltransferase [Pontibacter litorisediminis]|uniref:GNAT family N-acetyltransferase n=1 Tax=Pontibacter litorisediminis TaxID=1846260 RepID=UPI0023EAC531|nr:GNAT family N-acetyltransferase [Pontibacter litorisediminis]
MPNKNTVEVEVTCTYASPPEQVYGAWLNAQMARQWFAPGLGETEPVQLDAKVGGKFRIVQVRDGQAVGHHGKYLALDQPHYLSFTWAMDDMEEEDTVRIYIKPAGSGSAVRLVHEMDEAWKAYADRTREAWLAMMQHMDKLISRNSIGSSFATFETERLIIRPTSCEDAPFILELLNTPQWLQYIGDRNVKSVKAAEEYISSRMLPQLKRLGYGNYTVIRKADGAKLGTCGLYDREGLTGIDIGFAFLPQHEKQGYAFEAACKLKDAAFEHFGLKHLCAITTKDNQASQKLLEKLGLRYSGLVQLPNDAEQLLLYELLVE